MHLLTINSFTPGNYWHWHEFDGDVSGSIFFSVSLTFSSDSYEHETMWWQDLQANCLFICFALCVNKKTCFFYVSIALTHNKTATSLKYRDRVCVGAHVCRICLIAATKHHPYYYHHSIWLKPQKFTDTTKF